MKRHLGALFLVLVFLPALVHGFGVTKVKNYIRALPAKFQCPVTLKFHADITTDGACDVKFTWLRSDGFRTPEVILHFDRAETLPIYYEWLLPVYNAVVAMQRVRVEIVSPNHIDSNWAGSCVHCRPR